ncbi:probable LRR receptor-like serine/threonine-protein kinase At3g47570 [Lactuca sativa]|uniref:non-specific serine/threonine protein kinase n=1 Tax=Lactuca sativa TaxID=4236 RepID=A0A9R1XTR3_LACSA|nr:probable LRR receptor-like serine/threonine-protein kinase At3g47570 [Lactuca sativa]KAJ0225501.1 hypothetical protein LSAT_V11C100017960 [Lactuca sativa]
MNGWSGSISPEVGNMSFLRELILYNNSFTGVIPQEIGRLSKLRRLGLSNNSLSGEIPSNISRCRNLVALQLNGNNFIGAIPNEFESLTKLLFINLHSNDLTGEIPKFIGNFTSLMFISGLGNNFHGSIPDTLGQLSNLWFFGFAENNLSGVLPPFFNLSSLTDIDLPNNQISGNLPSDFAQSFPRLESLSLRFNKFSGSIPVSLSNATNLERLALNANAFTGNVPTFDRLQRLRGFAININKLGNGKLDDLNFVSSLANCTKLIRLGFGANSLGGVLPKSMFNFTQLIDLTVGGNLISGNIPSEIGQLVNIRRLFLFSNQFTGRIPDSIGNLKNVGVISLRRNLLSGYMPSTFGNLTQLSRLYLDHNKLEGPLSSSLSKCRGLQLLDLSKNNFSGYIPKGIFSLSSLSIYLDLSDNHFVGSLPPEAGSLKNLGSFDVSNNMMSGVIPASLGACTSLVVLSVSGNTIQGEIPESFRSLRGLEILDLSNNNLIGKIPEFLGDFLFFKDLNLSFNGFVGKVPELGAFKNLSIVSIDGNTKLCGGFQGFQLPKCSIEESRKNRVLLFLIIMVPILTVIFGTLVVIFCLLYKSRYNNKIPEETNSDNENFPQVSYRRLHEATDGFSLANLIGSGTFSEVYKAILYEKNTPQAVAVKVLKLAVHGADKSFLAECEALRSIRHRNLVKIVTSCSGIDFQGNDFKALIYSYMVNGSLEEWLHQNPIVGPVNEAPYRCLNFLQRLNIMIDVAMALDYIHCQCGSPMVHCDLKPSNILLDDDLVAHLGDFGLSTFIQHDSSSSHTISLGINGTIGYVPPEHGMGSKISTCGDIYSFGILMLESFTGKRPTDSMFSSSLNLHDFVKIAMPYKVMEITDPVLFETRKEENMTENAQHHGPIEEFLTSIYLIGTACSMELPRDRLHIKNVIEQLQIVKKTFLETIG